jgi:hypothetical protein
MLYVNLLRGNKKMKKIYNAPVCEEVKTDLATLLAGSGLGESIAHKSEFGGATDYSEWYQQPTDVVSGDGDTGDNKAKGNTIWSDDEE